MFNLRKEVKLILVVFTIAFSIFLGVKRSNLDKLFVQSGCAVCHTIPGIDPANQSQQQR